MSSDAFSVPDIYLGLSRIRLGGTNAAGAADNDAWQQLGLDLDGLCTLSRSCTDQMQQPCRAPTQQVPFDGSLCRDNTAASLMAVLPAVPELGERYGLSEEVFNCNLRNGSYNVILKISNYNGRSNDADVRVDFYISSGMVRRMNWQCPTPDFADLYPLWRLADRWKIDPDNLTGPITDDAALPDSKIADARAYVRSDYLVVHFPDHMLVRLAGNSAYRGFSWVSSQNVWTGELQAAQDGRWHIHDGIIAGRIGGADLIRSFRRVGLCETSSLRAFYDTIVTYVDQNVDLRLDGSIDADKPCDAVSFGWGYEASQLTPGPAEKSPQLVECCEPEIAIEDCASR